MDAFHLQSHNYRAPLPVLQDMPSHVLIDIMDQLSWIDRCSLRVCCKSLNIAFNNTKTDIYVVGIRFKEDLVSFFHYKDHQTFSLTYFKTASGCQMERKCEDIYDGVIRKRPMVSLAMSAQEAATKHIAHFLKRYIMVNTSMIIAFNEDSTPAERKRLSQIEIDRLGVPEEDLKFSSSETSMILANIVEELKNNGRKLQLDILEVFLSRDAPEDVTNLMEICDFNQFLVEPHTPAGTKWIDYDSDEYDTDGRSLIPMFSRSRCGDHVSDDGNGDNEQTIGFGFRRSRCKYLDPDYNVKAVEDGNVADIEDNNVHDLEEGDIAIFEEGLAPSYKDNHSALLSYDNVTDIDDGYIADFEDNNIDDLEEDDVADFEEDVEHLEEVRGPVQVNDRRHRTLTTDFFQKIVGCTSGKTKNLSIKRFFVEHVSESLKQFPELELLVKNFNQEWVLSAIQTNLEAGHLFTIDILFEEPDIDIDNFMRILHKKCKDWKVDKNMEFGLWFRDTDEGWFMWFHNNPYLRTSVYNEIYREPMFSNLSLAQILH